VTDTCVDRFPAAHMLEVALALTRPPMQPERHYPADLLQAAEDRYGPGLKIRQVIYFVARANGYTGSPFIDKRSFGDAMYYAWTLPMTVRAAGTSTLSLPAILTNLANKELLDAYREEDQTWREIAIVRSVSDIKTVTSYRLIGKDQYELVAPGGEIKHGTLGNDTYSNRADTYGLMLSIDRREGISKIQFNRGDELLLRRVSLPTKTLLAIHCDGSLGHSHPSSHSSSLEREFVESVYRTPLAVVEPETSTLEWKAPWYSVYHHGQVAHHHTLDLQKLHGGKTVSRLLMDDPTNRLLDVDLVGIVPHSNPREQHLDSEWRKHNAPAEQSC
jgi:hypothetical protein